MSSSVTAGDSQLPASVRKLILKTTHLSGESVSRLVERVLEALSESLHAGEAVEVVSSGERGVVVGEAKLSPDSASPGSDKENSAKAPASYAVQLQGSKKRLTVSEKELRRVAQPDPEDIEEFICSAALRVDSSGQSQWRLKPAFAKQMDAAASPAAAKPNGKGTNGNGFLHVETQKTTMEEANEAVTSNLKSPLASPLPSPAKSATSPPARPSLDSSGFGPLPPKEAPKASSSSSSESEDDDAPSPPSNRLSGGFAPSAVKAKKAQADAAKKRAQEAKDRKRQEEKDAKDAAREKARREKEAARKEKSRKKTLDDFFTGKSDKVPAVSTGDSITLGSSDEDDVPLASVASGPSKGDSGSSNQPSSTSGSSAAFDAAKRAAAVEKLKGKSPGLKKKLGMNATDRMKEQKKLEARLNQLSSSPKKSSVIDLLRGSASQGPKKTPASPKKALTPAEMQRLRVQATVKKLSKAWAKEGAKSAVVSNLVNMTAKILTRAQIEGQVEPDELRDRCVRAHEALEEKKKMEKMSPEEKEAYLKERRKEKIREANQKRKRAMEKARQRFEDTKIPDLKPLPALEEVALPASLPNEAFGDVVAVTEFGKAYAGLLSSEKAWALDARELAQGVACAGQGWSSVAKLLVPMLQTLLQDEVASDYRHLGLRLAQLTVSEANASELLRLCLRKKDDQEPKKPAAAKTNGKPSNEEAGSPAKEDEDEEMSDLRLEDEEEKMEEDEEEETKEAGDVDEGLVAALEAKELWELSPSEILQLLNAVLMRLLDSYSVNEYQATIHAELAEVTKEKADWAKEVAEVEAKLSPLKELPPLKPEFPRPDEESAEDSDGPRDLSATIASRRAQAREEKIRREERERLEKKHAQRSRDAEKRTAKWDQIERKFQDTLQASRTTTRLTPLGTDRFHRRYWLTSQPSAALFVETAGWARLPPHTDRSASQPSLLQPPEAEVPKAEEEAKTEGSDDETPLGVIAKKAALDEETAPETSEPAHWLQVVSVAQLDDLLDSLAEKGQREGDLLPNIRLHEKALRKILAAKAPAVELGLSQEKEAEADKDEKEPEDEEKEGETNEEEKEKKSEAMETGPAAGPEASVTLLESLRLDLIALVKRLSEGGLANFEKDPGQLLDDIDLAPGRDELKQILLAVFKSIHSKFYKGFMSESYWGSEPEEGGEEGEEKEGGEESRKGSRSPQSEWSHFGKRVGRWVEAVEGARTTSALHVAMDMLEACVDWSRSAENARCRQCKRKGLDDSLLLCDDCNAAFHLHCLRPALSRVPRGDWFCPSCKPKHQAKLRKSQDDEEEEDSEDSEEEEEEEKPRRAAARKAAASGGSSKAKKARKTPARHVARDQDLFDDDGSSESLSAELCASLERRGGRLSRSVAAQLEGQRLRPRVAQSSASLPSNSTGRTTRASARASASYAAKPSSSAGRITRGSVVRSARSEVDIRAAVAEESSEESGESSEEEAETRRPSRQAKAKAKAAIKEQEAADPAASTRASRRRSPSPPPNPLQGELERRLDLILKSRLASSIDSLPDAGSGASSTRSRPSKGKPHCDINSIKERLRTYGSLEAFYDDVEAAIAAGLLHWEKQSRKVSALEELSELVAEQRSELDEN